MNKVLLLASLAIICVPSHGHADVLCKDKKSGVVASRKSCKKTEAKLSPLAITGSATVSATTSETALGVLLQDSSALSSGSDSNTGFDVSVSRLGATGGTLNNTGVNISVAGDSGGDSTNIGLMVDASGADTNYSALFQGGNVGIGLSSPDELLDLNGRMHLRQSSAPGTTSDKLYNVGGTLYWSGQQVGLGSSGGTITGVTAGTGLTGGGTTGNVSLSVDTGTSANDIVQLNSSGELPAVSGANLSSLNASSLGSGVIPDGRLSSNVSLLGQTIGLASSEVSGVLPIANGGTGASSLSNLIALGTSTTGNYVASIADGTGISGGAAGTEGAALTLSVDQAFSPTWTGTHSFQGLVNMGTSTASVEALHLNGRMQIEPGSAPLVTTNKLYNVAGEIFFNGVNLSSNASAGDITGVTAGTGLTGGGTSGAVTLNVDVGTTANKIVQLNSSAELPALSAANLTAINATNITSGTLPDGRLSSSVSLLGSTIGLNTAEVAGTLAISNGGTGATSLNNLITLGTHTTGNYLSTISGGTGISVSGSGGESATPTVSLDQSVAAVWTSGHTFSGVSTDITTGSNQDFCIVPNGTGKVGIGTTSPSAELDTVYTSTSATSGTETGVEFNYTDTGSVSTGTDASTGAAIVVSRTGAQTGSTVDTTGLNVSVTGDTGGTSTATGLNVAVSGADTNYAAILTGGNVGIGTTSPTARLHTVLSSTSSSAGTEIGELIGLTDSGSVSSGTDTSLGASIVVSRTNGQVGAVIDSTGLNVSVTGDTGGTSTATGLNVAVSGADTNYAAILTGGNVGIGTASPTSRLHTVLNSTSSTAGSEIGQTISVTDSGGVSSGTDTTEGLNIALSRTTASGGTINNTGLRVAVSGDTGGTSANVGLTVSATGADTNVAAAFTAGKVVIGSASGQVLSTNVPTGSLVIDSGALCIDDDGANCSDLVRNPGSIYAEDTSITSIDLAENFPIEENDPVEAGEIVVVNTKQAEKCLEWSPEAGSQACTKTTKGNIPFVTRSSGEAKEQKRILGIVSTKPGITLGGFGKTELRAYKKVPIALAGRVPLKVTLENGEIEVGDRLSMSSTAGQGMKARPGDRVVAIALEPFDGKGASDEADRILVLVKQ